MSNLPPSLVNQNDAMAIITQLLDQFDLGSLADWAWKEITGGASTAKVQMDLYQQPAFKTRFPVIEERQKAGLPPVSPAEIVAYEDSWRQLAVAAGMPPSIADRSIAQNAMAKDISVAELQSRVNDGYAKVAQVPQVAAEFDQYFGTGKGAAALAAVFVDPERALPDLERMVGEAQIGASGGTRGFNINETTAQSLFDHGVTQTQADQGFSTLDQERALFNNTIDEKNNPLVAEQQGVAAVFGTDATSAEAVRRRAAERQAQFGGSDQAQVGQEGVTGLGSAKVQ